MLGGGRHVLAGDEKAYDAAGALIAIGRWFWSTAPYGVPHPSTWKAPGYELWVGLGYELLGTDYQRVLVAQAVLLGPLTIVLTWALGRRLFGPAVGLAAAAVVALWPFAWQYEVRLYSEALAVPMALGVLLLVLERRPGLRLAAGTGLLLAALALTRPSTVYLVPAVVAAWALTDRSRRGLAMAGVAIATMVVVIVPWTVRNQDVTGAFIPISMQDAAPYGVFNDDAANDPVYPWAWRPVPRRDADLFRRPDPLPEAELRRALIANARAYVSDNPVALPKAFFWNGLSRLWDIRRPSRVVDEAETEGRDRGLTGVGLALYWPLLALALAALWLFRARRALVVPLLVAAVAASVVYTTGSGTRYRAAFEPVIAVLACAAVARAAEMRRRAV